jgi:myosin heavy subunit
MLCAAYQEGILPGYLGDHVDLALRDSSQYFYLNQGECVEVEDRSDSQCFSELLEALHDIGINEASIVEIVHSLAGVLTLGNIAFMESTKSIEAESSEIANWTECNEAARFLGIVPTDLASSLCSKTTVFNGETITIPLSPAKAAEQRDAMAKSVYERIFNYLIDKINATMMPRQQVSTSAGTKGTKNASSVNNVNAQKSIGILDIFGFEVFKVREAAFTHETFSKTFVLLKYIVYILEHFTI